MSASIFVPKEEPQRTYHHWYDTIQRYTEREFTYADDLIPAVQGLINEVKTIIGVNAIGGLGRDLSREDCCGVGLLVNPTGLHSLSLKRREHHLGPGSRSTEG